MLHNNQDITEEIKEEIKKIPRNKWEWNHEDPKPMGCSKGSSKREVYSNTILPKVTGNISNKQAKLTRKELEKEEQKNPKVNRRKEIINIRSEINEKEMKETVAKINKTESWFFEKINKIDNPDRKSVV